MKPGEKVICIKDNPDGDCPVKMGDIVDVLGADRCKCGALMLDLGISVNMGRSGTMCPICDQAVYTDRWLQDARRFRSVSNDDFNHGKLYKFTVGKLEVKTKQTADHE